MRVHHVIGGLLLASGGPTFALVGLANAQHDIGMSTWLHRGDMVGDNGLDMLLPGVNVRSYKCDGPPWLGLSRTMVGGLEAECRQGDVIQCHGLWMLYLHQAARAARRTACPLVVSPHGMLDPWALQQRRLKKLIANHLYQRADLRSASCLHALCTSEARSIAGYGITAPIALIPNGVETPDEHGCLNDTRARCLRRPDERVLLFLSRLHPKKGILPLIRAWRASGVASAGWRLVFVGPSQGGHRALAERLVAEFGLRDSVRFVGPQFGADKEAWFNRASAFVLTSFSEGLPVAVLEAMAHRLPVLISNACNLPQVEEWGAGVTCSAEIRSISKALKKLAAMDHGHLASMGMRGYHLVCEEFTWHSAARKTLLLYEWLIGLKPKPGFVALPRSAEPTSAHPSSS